jgi:hypothetical protein
MYSPRGAAKKMVGGGFRRRPETATDGSRRARERADTEAGRYTLHPSS